MTYRSNATHVALFLICAVSLAGASGCSIFTKRSATTAASQAPAAAEESDAGTAGIRDVNELAASMSKVTGVPLPQAVPSATPAITLAQQAADIAPWLSADGNPGTVNSSMLLSITGLAASFCRALLATESAASAIIKVHTPIDFTRGPAGLDLGVRQAMIVRYSRLFWRRDPTAEEIQILDQAIVGAITDAGPLSPTATTAQKRSAAASVLMVPCTAALSSLDFLKA